MRASPCLQRSWLTSSPRRGRGRRRSFVPRSLSGRPLASGATWRWPHRGRVDLTNTCTIDDRRCICGAHGPHSLGWFSEVFVCGKFLEAMEKLTEDSIHRCKDHSGGVGRWSVCHSHHASSAHQDGGRVTTIVDSYVHLNGSAHCQGVRRKQEIIGAVPASSRSVLGTSQAKSPGCTTRCVPVTSAGQCSGLERTSGRSVNSVVSVGPVAVHCPPLLASVSMPRRSGGIGRRASLRGWCP